MKPEDVLKAAKNRGKRDQFYREALAKKIYLHDEVEKYIAQRMLEYVPPQRVCEHFGGKAT